MEILISKFNNENVENSIQEMEKRYNFVFPEEYRMFLKKYNGGKTPDTTFHLQGISSDIQAFYGLAKADMSYNISMIENTPLFFNMVNNNLFPIAINSFGDDVLIGLRGDNAGKIYFCYHDISKGNIELSPSLSVFLSCCRSQKIGHIRTIEERIADMKRMGKGNKVTEVKLKCWQEEIDEYSQIKQEKVTLGYGGLKTGKYRR